MKVLVTGANGQLGYDVVTNLKENNKDNIECLGIDIEDVDITNEQNIKSFIINFKPDIIVHCAAYTAVDKAEEEKELCHKVNVLGTRHIAEACQEIGAKMVYISTDYVFGGNGDTPFETSDIPNPINYYGKTKYEGELEIQKLLNKFFIVRISWVFGKNGNNFVKTMLRLGKERNEISVVSDQIGSPTYTYELANFLIQLFQTDRYGIYHMTNEGFCSWNEFACEIFRLKNMKVKVNPIASEEYFTKADRPKNSRLSKKTALSNGFAQLSHWKTAVFDFLSKLD